MTEARGAPTRFSATEAAFTGFRLLRRQPATVAVWGAAYLALSLFMGAGMVSTIGPSMAAIVAQQQAGVPPDPAASMALMSRVLPFEGLAMVALLGFYALMFAAVNRAVLRPGQGGPGRLALGGDELRQLLLFVVLGVIFFVAYVALLIVAVIVGIVLGVAASAGHGGGAAAVAGPFVGLFVLMILGVMLLLLALFTRLSLASPLTFDTDRLDVFGSWRLTRGIFWPLFGTYLMTWLLMIALYVAAFVLFACLAALLGGGLSAAGVALHPDMSSLAAYFTPAMILWIGLITAVGTVALTVMMAAPAGAYAQLKAMGRVAPLPSAPSSDIAPAPSTASDLPRFGR